LKVATTRRKTLTIGILLIVFSIIIINQGPQILDTLAESFGLAIVSQTQTPVLVQTLVSVPPSNYTYLPVALNANVPVTGSLEVAGGRELAFYVMNEGNFSQWRAGRPSAVVLVKSTVTYYNFTLTPTVDGTYYFVFDNPDPSGRNVVFSLNTVKNTVELPPLLQFGGYEILAIGIIFSFLGVRGGKKKPKPVPPRVEAPVETVKTTGWSCRYCGTKNTDNQIFCQSCGRSHQ
jgi:hypothetical protein